MTDSRFFAQPSSQLTPELWNVSLLPLIEPRVPSPAENLDDRRTSACEWGQNPTNQIASEVISSSFESQREAIGW